MTRSTAISAISCPTCGAGLDVLGGGRVTTHICGYCGTELDAQDGYRALSRFAALPRPDSPFRIGMTGQVQGVGYTVIGTLGMSDGSSWVDHLMFSPTHGYAWLSVEMGHLIWTRRYRKAVAPRWISTTQVETAEHPPQVRSEGETFKYYETSDSRITFAEGEFTWRPAIGDRSVTVTAMSDRHMLSFTETATEREVERSTYLPQAGVLASFGVDAPRQYGVHPLQPYIAGPHDAFLTRMALGFAAACLVLSVVFLSMSGTPVLRSVDLRTDQLPAEIPLQIDSPGKLAHIRVTGDVNNSWAWIELALADPEDQPVFIAGREMGYYTGSDADGAWTEGSRSVTFAFRPEAAGTYTLEVDAPESEVDIGSFGAPLSHLTVTASNGASSPFWTLVLAGVFCAVAAWKGSGAFLHNRKRWRGTDWTEDDAEDED